MILMGVESDHIISNLPLGAFGFPRMHPMTMQEMPASAWLMTSDHFCKSCHHFDLAIANFSDFFACKTSQMTLFVNDEACIAQNVSSFQMIFIFDGQKTVF